jgi:hypothetical protein
MARGGQYNSQKMKLSGTLNNFDLLMLGPSDNLRLAVIIAVLGDEAVYCQSAIRG